MVEMRTTPSMEDYLEAIFRLEEARGQVRVSDLAAYLGLQPSSVTRMVQKLGEKGWVRYERYRGLGLTPRGVALGRALHGRHLLLARFLQAIGVEEGAAQDDVEGIEHHLSSQSLGCLEDFVAFLEAHPAWRDAFAAYRAARAGEPPAPVIE